MLYTIQTALTSSIQFFQNIPLLFFRIQQNLKQFPEIESPGPVQDPVLPHAFLAKQDRARRIQGDRNGGQQDQANGGKQANFVAG